MDKLEAAQFLQTSLDKLPLRIVNARSRFDSKQSSDEPYFQGEGSAPTDPALVSVDVTSQLVSPPKVSSPSVSSCTGISKEA